MRGCVCGRVRPLGGLLGVCACVCPPNPLRARRGRVCARRGVSLLAGG